MKHTLFLLLLIVATNFIKADPPKPTAPSKMKFNTVEHDFGSQAQGKPVTFEFQFTNTGNDPIVLEDVKASCGCTTPTWTKEPVLPSKTGVIKAQYNMAREGAFRKSITVTTKDGESVVLYISGNAITQKQGIDDAEENMIGGKQ